VSRPGDRLSLEVVTTSGTAAAVEIRVQPDTVEIWRGTHCSGVFDRTHLRGWLDTPESAVRVDEVTFSVDRLVDRDGRVAISMADISGWTLSPQTLADLRRRL
jgi:hypothetical protein